MPDTGEKKQGRVFTIIKLTWDLPTDSIVTISSKHLKSSFTIPIFLLWIVLISCDVEESPDQLPFVYVNIEINVNDLRYLDLHSKGYIYLQGGLRGILLVKKTPNEYLAFERNCTFEYEKECSVVEMHESGFYMLDPCCESTFDLEGNPAGGPAQFNLRTYYTYLTGNTLSIQSDPF